MNDSADKLNTPKFKKLREKPVEYLKELEKLAIKHGLDLAIKQIKRSDIVISRSKGQKYEKLFEDVLKLLTKQFSSKYKQIKQFKYEPMLLKRIYKHTISELLSDNWITKKKIIKVLLTSCCLGEYLFLHDCHVLDIEVFNAWLFNKEIVWRDIKTMEKIHVSSAKKQGSLLDRFELLSKEIDILKYKREQCTMVINTPSIGGLQTEFPMYLQYVPDRVLA